MTYFALFTWPIVIIILQRKYGISTAVIVGIIGGYLLLPSQVGINLPLIPSLNKGSIPAVTLFILGSVMAADAMRQPNQKLMLEGWLPRDPLMLCLLMLMIFSPFITGLLNGDALTYGLRRLPGLKPYDAFSATLNAAMVLVPVLVARKFLAHPDRHAQMLMVLTIAGLLYSLLALYEVRMSPQLNRMVYGFFPHSWQQHLRGDGFRPVVFLSHGLWLGIFLAVSALASLAVLRIKNFNGVALYAFGFLWLLGTLLLSKNLGASVIVFALIPAMIMLQPRGQMTLAAVVAMIVISYPVLRSSDIIPTDQLVNAAKNLSEERAGSLQYRFNNEDILLDKAFERPAFGWGGWGRSRVFDEKTNEAITVDGRWIIAIGQGGWTRYIAEFGFLTMPIILLWLRRKRLDIGIATSCLAVILSANLIDLLPNASLTPVTWILAGALIGRLEIVRVDASEPSAEGLKEQGRSLRYTRWKTDKPTATAALREKAQKNRPGLPEQQPYSRYKPRTENG